jgi:hypothetical protein
MNQQIRKNFHAFGLRKTRFYFGLFGIMCEFMLIFWSKSGGWDMGLCKEAMYWIGLITITFIGGKTATDSMTSYKKAGSVVTEDPLLPTRSGE